MNKELSSIIRNLQNVNSGQPWYGRPVYEMLEEIDPAIVYKRPNKQHSLIELLYHMITWAEFTLRRIEGDKEKDMAAFEKLDWREIDPKKHTWQKGIAEFKTIHEKIIALLGKKDDAFLKEDVDYRKYNFRFLLNGLIQHNIYHTGQIAYVKKLLE
ncbi:MAG TPA: DinB family protein [Chitinophagaceae bacterium]|nr:DinB family protein [Chitinophagaceae bacterium]